MGRKITIQTKQVATRTTVISIKGHIDLDDAIGCKRSMEHLPGEVTGIVLDLPQMRYTYSVCAGYLLETPLNRKMAINIVAKGRTNTQLRQFVGLKDQSLVSKGVHSCLVQ